MNWTDLSVGVISVLTDIVWKITVAWHAGNIACKVIRFSQVRHTVLIIALSREQTIKEWQFKMYKGARHVLVDLRLGGA